MSRINLTHEQQTALRRHYAQPEMAIEDLFEAFVEDICGAQTLREYLEYNYGGYGREELNEFLSDNLKELHEEEGWEPLPITYVIDIECQ